MTPLGKVIAAFTFVISILALGIVLFLLTGCTTQQIKSDTRLEQQEARKTAEDLQAERKANPTIPTTTQRTMIVAEKQLNQCADVEEACDAKIKKANDALAACQTDLEEGGTFWTRTKNAVGAFWKLVAFSVVSFAIGTFVGKTILSMAWAALKAALHLG